MAGSTSKKVVAIRFDREPLSGFVNPQSYLQPSGVELLTVSGTIVQLPYSELKALCFVRDFDPGPVWKEHRAFANRPKTEGLWLRFAFRDSDTLEAVISNNLLVMESPGVSAAPPDPGSLVQKVFIPRAAVVDIKVLGVVGSPLRRHARAKPPKDQLEMFE